MKDALPIPKISVILPTHNRPSLLNEAISSVRAQTYPNWELIIVDDASTPPVTNLNDSRIRLKRNQISCGGAQSKNIGISSATGDHIAFLDDDDLYDPLYLERAADALISHPEIDVIFMGVSWFGERASQGERAYTEAMSSLLARVKPNQNDKPIIAFESAKLFSGLLRTVPMAFQRPVARRESFASVGNYNPDILLWDSDWAIRAALQLHCALLPDTLYRQRASGQGFSSQTDRRNEHLRANALMKEQLFALDLTPEQQAAVRESLYELWFGASWSALHKDEFHFALKHLLLSTKYSLRLSHFKLAARIIARGITRLGRRALH